MDLLRINSCPYALGGKTLRGFGRFHNSKFKRNSIIELNKEFQAVGIMSPICRIPDTLIGLIGSYPD